MKRLVSRIELSQLDKMMEGRLLARCKRIRAVMGPTIGQRIPAIVENSDGAREVRIGKDIRELMMSKMRRRTAGYKCGVGNCCWREWTWGGIVDHMRSCHGVTTPKSSMTVWGLHRSSFTVATETDLPSVYARWRARKLAKERRSGTKHQLTREGAGHEATQRRQNVNTLSTAGDDDGQKPIVLHA